MRWMGGIGLLLSHERRRVVVRFPCRIVRGSKNAVRSRSVELGRTGQHHEIRVPARYIQRIVRLQRNIDGSSAAFADQVETMVEELAKKGHPALEGCGQALNGCDVGNDQAVALHFAAVMADKDRKSVDEG